MNGWIKLHRKALDHWLYNEPRPHTRREAWEDILLLSNHSDTKVLISGQLIDCRRGQSVMSLKSWAKQFRWSIQQVRTFFKVLENDSMINVEGLKYSTRITVCKYDDYQNMQLTDNKLTTNSKQTNNTKQEGKESKEHKEGIEDTYVEIIDLFHSYCPNLPKVTRTTESRKKVITARLKEFGIEGIKECFSKVAESDFLQGKVTNFKANFDFIMKSSIFLKILENTYLNNSNNGNKSFKIKQLATADQHNADKR